MQFSPLTLAFRAKDSHLEEIFLKAYNHNSLFQIRIALLLGVVLYALFALLDSLLFIEQKNTLWGIRFLVFSPYALLVVTLSYFKRFQERMQLLGASVLIVAGVGIITIITIAPPPLNIIYFTGLILVIMYTYGFSKLRFVYATATGWILLVCFGIIEMRFPAVPLNLFISNNFFFVTANFIGMATSYSMEYYTRKNFFLLHQLEEKEKKVEAINDNLENNVLERTTQLLESNKKLSREIEVREKAELERREIEAQLLQSQKLEAMGSLAGGIAHDFNNILSSLIGNAELALFSMEEKNAYKHCMEQIVQSGKRARDLVTQILEFSRIQPENEELVDISPILKDTLKLLKSTIPPNIKINSTIGSNLKKIRANSSRLHQVILNICTNAAHAMEPEGGILHVELTNNELAPGDLNGHRELTPGSYVKLLVEDTGHGMNDKTRQRIFDPFFTTKKQGKGTGLGLSIVHGIVKSLGGNISVQSEDGKGSSFEILVPAANQAESIKREEKNTPPPQGNQERILFVDNEKDIVDLIVKMFPRLGYRVQGETKPGKALEIFRAQPNGFDLVITDMTMPEMTGDTLADEMMKIRPDIPILISTGYSNTMTPEKVRELGVNGLLYKPVTIKKYAEAIQSALKKNDLRIAKDE